MRKNKIVSWDILSPETIPVNDKERYRTLMEEFARLTRNFDIDDWTALRTPRYWKETDRLYNQIDIQLSVKLKHIRYYYKHGKPL